MPYIQQYRRPEYDEALESLKAVFKHGDWEPGDLNYTLTSFILSVLGPNPNYTAYNEVIGVLESVKLELYRRHIAPYEDYKKDENGDVYL